MTVRFFFLSFFLFFFVTLSFKLFFSLFYNIFFFLLATHCISLFNGVKIIADIVA